MKILTDFGKRVKELRLQAGMTQELLASLAELDRSYVGSVERGEKNLSLINISKIANALDVDISFLFEDERFSPRSTLLRKEMKKPLEERFVYDVDVMEQIISWRIAGPLSEHDVQDIAQKIKNISLLLKKGETRLFIDNRFMVIDGLTYVFPPQVNAVWEELQMWLLPFVKKVVVLCNSKLMKNQLDRLAKRSGISKMSIHIYHDDPSLGDMEALNHLMLTKHRLLETTLSNSDIN